MLGSIDFGKCDEQGRPHAELPRALIHRLATAPYELVAMAAPLSDPLSQAAKSKRVQRPSWLAALANRYAVIGEKSLSDLSGAFAVAFWSPDQERLVLSCDSAGLGKLFYAADGSRLVFSSNLADLTEELSGQREIDLAALDAFLAFGYVPAPLTLIDGVRRVCPGEVLQFCRSSIAEATDSIVEPPSAQEDHGGASDLAQRLRSSLLASVQTVLHADPETGFLLSGGVDTAALVACARELGVSPRTYTLSLRGAEIHDESQEARRSAELLGSEHHEIAVGAECIEGLARLTRSAGAPIGNPAALLASRLLQSAGQASPTICCGDGGNEVFGGVYKFQLVRQALAGGLYGAGGPVQRLGQWLWHELRGTRLEPLVQAGARILFELTPQSRGSRTSPQAVRAAAEYYVALEAIWPWPRDTSVYSKPVGNALAPEVKRPAALAELVRRASTPRALLQNLPWARVNSFVSHNVALYLGVSAHLAGVTLRLPYVSRSVLRFAYSLPHEQAWGQYRGLMRAAFGGNPLPQRLFDAPHKGFDAPVQLWGDTALWRDYIHQVLSPRRIESRGLFNPRSVARLLDLFRKGTRSLAGSEPGRRYSVSHVVWCLVALEEFCDEFRIS